MKMQNIILNSIAIIVVFWHGNLVWGSVSGMGIASSCGPGYPFQIYPGETGNACNLRVMVHTDEEFVTVRHTIISNPSNIASLPGGQEYVDYVLSGVDGGDTDFVDTPVIITVPLDLPHGRYDVGLRWQVIGGDGCGESVCFGIATSWGISVCVIPMLEVLAPNGSEVLTEGDTYPITWSSFGSISNVLIEYSIDNGSSWISVDPNTGNTGSYNWLVPEEISDQCLIRVSDANNPSISDISDATFTIAAPNAQPIARAGDDQTLVDNNGDGIEQVTLDGSDSSDSDGWIQSYVWSEGGSEIATGQTPTVNLSVGEHIITLTVTDDDGATGMDTMKIVVLKLLNVLLPNGGELLTAGNTYPITWSSFGFISNVLIEYSTDNGSTWISVDPNTGNTGSYNWLVPVENSNQCLIRVSDASNPSINDTSDAVFRIIANVIHITTCEELQNMQNDLSGNYVLDNDINCSCTRNWNNGNGFIPVGNAENPFTGTFDGQGYNITYLYINRSINNYQGLIGYTDGAVIQNIGLINVYVSGNNYVGALVGLNSGTISNSYAISTVSGDRARNYYPDYVGGLVGLNSGTISNSYAIATVSGDDSVGGLVGINGGTISKSYAIATVSGNDVVGGLIGWAGGTISNSYAISTVSGDCYLGGLVGVNDGTISNSYAISTIPSAGWNWRGELVGFNRYGACINSFWNIDLSPAGGGGEGKTTAEMKQQATFAGWDFVGETTNGTADIWRMCVDDMNYPRLAWEFSEHGDFTCPDGVDFRDFAILASAWHREPNDAGWNPDCDISHPSDNVVDVLDLAVFCNNWLQGQ